MEYLCTPLSKKDLIRLQQRLRSKTPIKSGSSPTYFDRLPAELRQDILDLSLHIDTNCRASLQEHCKTLQSVRGALPALREDLLYTVREYLMTTRKSHDDNTFALAVFKTLWVEQLLVAPLDVDPLRHERWDVPTRDFIREVLKTRFYCGALPECSLPDLKCRWCGRHDNEPEPLRKRQRLAEEREYERRAALVEELQITWRDYLQVLPSWATWIAPLVLCLILLFESPNYTESICFFEDIEYWKHLCFLPITVQLAIVVFLPCLLLWAFFDALQADEGRVGAKRRAEIYRREKLQRPLRQSSKTSRFLGHLITVLFVTFFAQVTAILLYAYQTSGEPQLSKRQLEIVPLAILIAIVLFPFIDLGPEDRDDNGRPIRINHQGQSS